MYMDPSITIVCTKSTSIKNLQILVVAILAQGDDGSTDQ